MIASLFEKRASGVYHNTAAMIDADGSLLGIYRKMHIPDDPLFYEKFYFTPGDLGFQGLADEVWKNRRAGLLGSMVSRKARASPRCRGRRFLFYPTAIGWHPKEKEEHGANQHGAWELIQRSHAVANGCYVAVVNRIGHEAPVGGDGWNSGARVLWLGLPARFLRKRRRQGGNPGRAGGPGQSGRDPHALAVPAGSPY